MKYSFELKKEIYKKHCEGYGSEILSKEYGINASKIRYMCRLVDKHGLEAIWINRKSVINDRNPFR
jgi:transposase-like protein